MSKFYFYKIGRHLVLCHCEEAERYRVTMMRKHGLDVFNASTMTVALPSRVLVKRKIVCVVKRKIVCVVAKTRDDAVSWLKAQKWSEL